MIQPPERMHFNLYRALKAVQSARYWAESADRLDGWAEDLFLLEHELARLTTASALDPVKKTPPPSDLITTATYRNLPHAV